MADRSVRHHRSLGHWLPGRRRRRFILLSLTAAAVVAAGLATAAPAQAIQVNCSNGDHLPNTNNTDVCFVSTADSNVQFVGTFKVADDCSATATTFDQTRVRIIGSWVSAGRKLLIKSVGIRYVSGTKPWATYSIGVRDGNGKTYPRPWNNNGLPINDDPAEVQSLGDNVTSVNTSPGFAPPFGSGNVTVNFRAFFYNTSAIFPGQQACASEGMALIFKPPV
jgi:hypothetical protein